MIIHKTWKYYLPKNIKINLIMGNHLYYIYRMYKLQLPFFAFFALEKVQLLQKKMLNF